MIKQITIATISGLIVYYIVNSMKQTNSGGVDAETDTP